MVLELSASLTGEIFIFNSEQILSSNRLPLGLRLKTGAGMLLLPTTDFTQARACYCRLSTLFDISFLQD
jgi:hypothetical protein